MKTYISFLTAIEEEIAGLYITLLASPSSGVSLNENGDSLFLPDKYVIKDLALNPC